MRSFGTPSSKGIAPRFQLASPLWSGNSLDTGGNRAFKRQRYDSSPIQHSDAQGLMPGRHLLRSHVCRIARFSAAADPRPCPVVAIPAPAHSTGEENPVIKTEVLTLRSILSELAACGGVEAKVKAALFHPRVTSFKASHPGHELWSCLPSLAPKDQYVLLAVLLAGQEHVLQPGALKHGERSSTASALQHLALKLSDLESFYDSMGGIVGYQLKSLELIIEGSSSSSSSAPAPNAPTVAEHSSGNHIVTAPPRQGRVEFEPSQPPPESPSGYRVPFGPDLAGEEGRRLGVRVSARCSPDCKLLHLVHDCVISILQF